LNAALIDNTEAVDRLAASLTTRQDFIILSAPEHINKLASRLRAIPPGWTAYLANRSPRVLVTGDPILMAASAGMCPPGGVTAVVTAPKSTTPAAALSRIFEQEIPADGSRDVILLLTPGGQGQVAQSWPLLFINALEQVDPASAASIYLRPHELR